MADLYNAPEIMNYYCTNECPIGEMTVPKLEIADLDRLTIKTLAAFNNTLDIKNILIDITEDGIITDCEKPKLEEVLVSLDKISKISQELRLWAEKNLE